jgi:hypothetical protein
MTYLEQRLTQYQILECNSVEIGIPDNLYDHPQCSIKTGYFESEPETDNIIINYISLNGEYQTYEKTKNGQPVIEIFKRTRIKEVANGFKYKQDFKSGTKVYFTPSIIEKYQQKKEIDTLFIVEGEFKSFVASVHLSIDIVGIGGIHNFADKETNELHPDLVKLIKDCKVQNVALLFDADLFKIKYEEHKDLTKRLYSFFSSVARFKELCLPLKTDLYFSHLKSDFSETAKGIDDLIILPETDKEALAKELVKLASGSKRKYIECFPLSRKSLQDLRMYFSIESPESFYRQYKEEINFQEFVYFKHVYQYDGRKLKLKKHSDADLYMRIGTDYFKRIFNVNKFGEVEESLDKWNIATIKSDYVHNGYKGFMEQIEKYDTFCNLPCNTDEYRLIHHVFLQDKISKNYNLYVKPQFILQKGSYENIFNYLKHITNSDGKDLGKLGDKLTIMLDYLTILYRFPREILPVIILVSKTQKTGKTTLFDLLKLMYGTNAAILSQQMFDTNFNAHYIQKLLIMLDEVKIKTKQDKNKIKQMTTSGKNYLQFKGVDPKEIDTYSKLMIASNDERNFMEIETDDVRFWVLKVPTLTKRDPKFLEKMRVEIPAFLHYISSREIIHPNEDRGWFEFNYLRTEQRETIIETTKPVIERDIEDFLDNYFNDYPVPDLNIGLQDLRDLIIKNSQYGHSKNNIKRTLSDVYNEKLSVKTKKCHYITGFKEGIGGNIVFDLKSNVQKAYTFLRNEWLKDKEIDTELQILPNSNKKTLESYEFQDVEETDMPDF